MKSNVALAIGSPYIMNPMTWLWRSMPSSQVVSILSWWKLPWSKLLVMLRMKDASTI
jgi:hypothetical protein